MIIQLEPGCTENQLRVIRASVEAAGYQHNDVTTQSGHYLVCIGTGDFDIRNIGTLGGIQDIHRVSDAQKLVSAKWKVGHTEISIADGVRIGNGHFQIMAGPCSIESAEQISEVAGHLKAHDVRIMRGGVFKPRTSPYSFRGLGIEGLKVFSDICRAEGICIITEVMQSDQIAAMYPYVDIFQVGARNMQNYNLLDALGEVDTPVLLKRGISGTIKELLYSAEYIFSGGNERIMLCERGIRTFEPAYRNTLDLNGVALLKEKTHLPVVVDPSHGIGIRRFVGQMTLAGVAAGADGVILEVHPRPDQAASDAQQTLGFDAASAIYRKSRALREVLAS